MPPRNAARNFLTASNWCAVSSITAQLAAIRLAQAQATLGSPPPPAAAPEPEGEGDEVAAILTQLELSQWIDALRAMGADSVRHLKELQDEDLQEIQMPRLHRRTLLRALGSAPMGGRAAAPGRSAIVDDREGGAGALVRTGSATAAPVGSWEFDDGPRGWKPLAPETQALVEAARAAGETSVTVRHGSWSYDVDLQAMTQTNTSTRKTRPLRRIS